MEWVRLWLKEFQVFGGLSESTQWCVFFVIAEQFGCKLGASMCVHVGFSVNARCV
jgi:hypothetical protein